MIDTDSILVFIGVVFLTCIIIGIINAIPGSGQGVKVQFSDPDTGRVVHTGTGYSIGSAMVDAFSKMYNSLSMSSKPDTIRSKLDSMNNAVLENKNRISRRDAEQCYDYINRTRKLLADKEAELEKVRQEREAVEREKIRKQKEKQAEQARKRAQAEKERLEREAAELEKKRKQKEKQEELARKKAQAEKERLEREKAMPVHKRFMAEQRRLMSDSLRYQVLARDNFRCQICGATQADGVKLHVDHIFPVSKGGKTELSNLRTLCERCNMGKRDRVETVRPKPAERPVIASNYPSMDDFIAVLNKEGIDYIDKRQRGGCLWIRSTPDTDTFVASVVVSGKSFSKAQTSATFGGKAGWFMK